MRIIRLRLRGLCVVFFFLSLSIDLLLLLLRCIPFFPPNVAFLQPPLSSSFFLLLCITNPPFSLPPIVPLPIQLPSRRTPGHPRRRGPRRVPRTPLRPRRHALPCACKCDSGAPGGVRRGGFYAWQWQQPRHGQRLRTFRSSQQQWRRRKRWNGRRRNSQRPRKRLSFRQQPHGPRSTTTIETTLPRNPEPGAA